MYINKKAAKINLAAFFIVLIIIILQFIVYLENITVKIDDLLN
jgi:hypothetical protein